MISKRVMLMALSNRQSYVKNVCKITCTVRQYASKKESGFFSKMMNRVTGSKQTEESELAREELERADRYMFVHSVPLVTLTPTKKYMNFFTFIMYLYIKHSRISQV